MNPLEGSNLAVYINIFENHACVWKLKKVFSKSLIFNQVDEIILPARLPYFSTEVKRLSIYLGDLEDLDNYVPPRRRVAWHLRKTKG
ncbi:hypothetical protein LguiB_025932 [Lonicera macranthoides]